MIRVCGAKARTNCHKPCQRIPMENGRCHLHGGKVPKHNPGPKTEAGKLRQKMASWKHGRRSKEAKLEKEALKMLLNKSKKLLREI